jgi:hypothetical protein
VTGTKSATATVEVYFDAEDPSDIDFARVSLAGMSPYIDVSNLFA